MERINNINFHQGMFERFIGAGDLDIESAGKDGQSHFDDVWHPDGVQQELYRQMEANAKKRAGWANPVPSRARGRYGRRACAADRARTVAAARRPARPGRDHRRRVRDEEGAAARAHVSAVRHPTTVRVVSLVPERERDAGRARRRAGRVHALLRARGRSDSGRYQECRRRRGGRARTGPRSRERRGEPHRGCGSARGPGAWRCIRCRRTRSPTSVPRSCALADERGVRRSRAPRRTGMRGWRRRTKSSRVRCSSRSGAGRGCRSRPTPTGRRCSRTSGGPTFSPTRPIATPRSRSPTSRRAVPTSCCCRASRTRSHRRHAAEVHEAVPDAAVTFVDGRDLFWWGIRTPAAAVRLGERASDGAGPGTHRRPRARRPARAVGEDGPAVREPGRDRAASRTDARRRHSDRRSRPWCPSRRGACAPAGC